MADVSSSSDLWGFGATAVLLNGFLLGGFLLEGLLLGGFVSEAFLEFEAAGGRVN